MLAWSKSEHFSIFPSPRHSVPICSIKPLIQSPVFGQKSNLKIL